MQSYRNENWSMPFDSPSYPTLPPYYRDTLFQMIYYKTEKDNIAAILPKPLEPADDRLCCAFGIQVPFCTHWGPFNEVGVCVKVVFEGKEAFFLSCLFLTSSDAIAPGREIWGCPKKIADITIEQHGSELTTTAVRAGVQFLQLNSRCMEPATPEEIPPLFPMYLLKMMPKAESNEAEIKQLVQNGELADVKIHKLFKGPGVVSFRPTVAGDFWRLEPKEYLGSYYQVCDYTQGHGKVVYDYLKK
jgi:acetoacetate decarboxylase